MRPRRLRLVNAALIGLMTAAAVVPSPAQTLDAPVTGHSLSSWTAADGRALGSVYAIAQDADHYLWLGTSDGLVRFDGAQFTAWSALSDDPLPPGAVTALHVAADGDLWVGFDSGGVRRLSGTRVVPLRASLDQLSQVTDLVQDPAGDMWAVADGALHVLRGGVWKPVRLPWTVAPGRVLQPVIFKDGSLWVATRWGVFRRVDQQDTFRLEDDRYVWGLTDDASGGVWITDIAAGFRRLGSAAAPRGLEGAGYRMLSDSRGNIWTGTFGDGLWRTRDGKVVERATLRTGLSSDSVLALAEDRDGNIWVGTTAGLHRLTPRRLTPAENIGFVLAVEPAAGGGMWVGTTTGIFRAHSAFDRPPARAPGTALEVRSMVRDGDTLWIGAAGGLWRLDDRGPALVTATPTPAFIVTSLSADGNGGFWLGDGKEVMHWDGRRLRPYAVDGAGATRVTFAGADRERRLWLGHSDGSVSVETPGGDRQSIAPPARPPERPRAIYSLFEDSGGTMWIAASDGLGRRMGRGIATINSRQGLPGDRVWSAVEDAQGYLWLSMDRGLVRVSRADLDAAVAHPAKRMRYRLYEPSDGLAGTPVGRIGSARALDGSLWFVRGGGLTVVDPGRLGDVPLPPVARVESVVANERRRDPLAGTAFDAGTRRLQIAYTAVTLTSPHRLRFRYRLDGFDSDWVTAGSRRTAFYTNLPPGDYRFRVEAQLEDGASNASSAVWDFSVRPAFYQTPWLAALVLAAGASTVWLAWWLRLRIVHRRFSAVLSERMRLSRELHDTLLQSLVGVALQVQAAAHDVSPDAPIGRRLVEIRRRIEAHIRETRHAIWEMRSGRLAERDLGRALAESGREAVAGTEVRFSSVVSGDPRRCGADLETNLLRICQEAVANAARHARASAIQVALDYAPDIVTLRVVDDGTGFDPGAPPEQAEHYGMSTMRERVEQLGGRFTLVSGPGQGTRIEVEVPAPEKVEVR
jgi:signal transduction histidine kinase/ligand-binding sensor domain-containing protein